jgi:delta 1-pyrroline-5-carboxylate dehydrogenase
MHSIRRTRPSNYRYTLVVKAASFSSIAPKPFKLNHLTGFIDGKWSQNDGDTFEVINPATGEVIANVGDMHVETAHLAVAAATRAQSRWGAETAQARGGLLMKLHSLIAQNSDALATLLSMECGKPFEEAKGEIAYSNSFIEWYAEEVGSVEVGGAVCVDNCYVVPMPMFRRPSAATVTSFPLRARTDA